MSDDLARWLQEFVASRTFLQRYPAYAAVLAGFRPVSDPSVAIMGVSVWGGTIYLHVCVDFFAQNPHFLHGVLLHEVHHVVLGHLTHPKFRGAAHPDLMELAMEISANEHITEALPGAPVTWKDFQHCGVGRGQSSLERYDLLIQARLEGQSFSLSSGWRVDDHHCSGVAGVYRLDEPPETEGAAEVERLLRKAAERAKEADGDGGSSGGLLAGKEPGQLIEELRGVEEEPQGYMDWKTAIQMFAARVRAPVHTYARPNRRFPERVGEIPGRMYYPGETPPPRIIVAIDTSASMSAEELAEIARQLRPLSAFVRITVVECDVVIQRVYPFEGAIGSVAGRGGTDLRPVFAPKFIAEHGASGVIYFTDGCGPYPDDDPGVKTLWVLSKPQEFDCPWGQKAYLPRQELANPPGRPKRRPGRRRSRSGRR